MKNLLAHSLLALTAWLMPGAALLAADTAYPSKPVRVVIPWPPGGLVDVAGRIVGEKLQAATGQAFVIENKTGAGGIIGAELVARAAPDGYTVALTTSSLNMNAALGSRMPFDVTNDFEPVAVIAFAPLILVAHPSVGAKSLQELIAAARAKPGKLTYASAGNGSPAHFAGELFKSMSGVDLVHVPYKGAPPAMTDLLAGRVDLLFANATVAIPQLKGGKVVAIATTGAKRFAAAPGIPTMAEAGAPGFEADQWLGYLAPKATPRAVIDRLAAEINKALALDEVRAALAQNGMGAAATGSPAAFGAYLKQDLAKWTGVVKTANIKPE